MDYVDTHCHIQSAGNNAGERITSDIWAKHPGLNGQKLIDQATDVGVSKLICVGCDVADSQLAVSFAQAHSGVWGSVGIHPHEARTMAENESAWRTFTALAAEPKVVAIGECGLDYFYNHSSKVDQVKILHKQLELAQIHNLPVIFHVREAYDDFWPIFDQYPGLRGVLHSYTDTVENMERAVGQGLYLGVNGIATFAKQEAQLTMYRTIPLSNLVLETDAPFLTPTPYRGSINEPKHIVTVASYLADLKSLELSELAATTTTNAKDLFGLD